MLGSLSLVCGQNPTPTPPTPKTPESSHLITENLPPPKETPKRPAYKSLRYEEDWSSLKDEANQTDYADKLKYVSLGREDFYLTVGGEARPYYEFIKNGGWGTAPKDSNGWLLQRYMLHGDFHLGKKFRVFTQLKSGLINNRNGGARSVDLDKLDINQLFIDYKLNRGTKKAIVFRIGRQEVSFGSSRILNAREGPNTRQPFDGFRVTTKVNDWTLDGLAIRPVSTEKGFFDDKPLNNISIVGFYSVSPAGVLTKKGRADFYYLIFDKKNAVFNQGSGRESRHSIGTRIWNNTNPLDYNFELTYQFGRFGKGNIRAWAAASDTGYTFVNKRLKPRIGLKANISSGDTNPQNSNLQTFNAIFPSGSVFGQYPPIGPLNHIDLHPSITVKPTSKAAISLDWISIWRTSKKDGIYNIVGDLSKPGNKSNEARVGSQFSIESSYKLDAHTTITSNYSYFQVGPFLKDNPPAKNTHSLGLWVTYKF